MSIVSTHSRLKAAGSLKSAAKSKARGFNTQPPEGGWLGSGDNYSDPKLFQHTAA